MPLTIRTFAVCSALIVGGAAALHQGIAHLSMSPEQRKIEQEWGDARKAQTEANGCMIDGIQKDFGVALKSVDSFTTPTPRAHTQIYKGGGVQEPYRFEVGMTSFGTADKLSSELNIEVNEALPSATPGVMVTSFLFTFDRSTRKFTENSTTVPIGAKEAPVKPPSRNISGKVKDLFEKCMPTNELKQ